MCEQSLVLYGRIKNDQTSLTSGKTLTQLSFYFEALAESWPVGKTQFRHLC
jgi:hypothetical protein